MKRSYKINCLILFVTLMITILGMSPATCAHDSDSKTYIADGLHLELTREFYESLLDEEQRGNHLYSNDPSSEYLKEISISTRFMVETNFQILKQQEMILQLLQSLLKDKIK